MPTLDNIALPEAANHWWIQLILLFALGSILSVLVKVVLSKLKSKWGEVPFCRVAAATLPVPLQLLVWIVIIQAMAQILAEQYQVNIPELWFDRVRSTTIILGLGWAAWRMAGSIEHVILDRPGARKSDQALAFALSRLASVLISVIMAVMLLSTIGINVSALLAVGGVGAFAVSWASKDIIANLFGGLMIYLNRPFSINDWIKSPNKNFEGTVEEIGWYMTRIRTFERRPTYIPNALITDAIIENPGRMYNRRIKFTVGVRYEDQKKVESIAAAIREMLQSHEGIDQNQLRSAYFASFGDSSLNIDVLCFTKTTETLKFREVQQDVLTKAAEIVDQHNAEMAFPTRTLHMQQG